ncbi:IgGFc-binding protein [Enhygromyxa salina]|uniref:IgGFc-binding protein n=1 Tax=Enhygromyxa salina TaxID=215803 RepID=UPI00215963CF|nr:IgGFc-binding protein [Enhygromyxa salina]
MTLPALTLGCADDGADDAGDSASETGTTDQGDGDGDPGDGDTNETGTADQGDGDGDPGDGDTDTDTGDGDDTTGDGDTGDGDGDTGDGDGDTGDGDGDTGDGDGDGDTEAQFCTPGNQVCADPDSYQVCDDQGEAWSDPLPCDPTEGCLNGDCVPQCILVQSNPSSVGCSFFATKHDNFYNNNNNPAQNDSLIAGNISDDLPVSAQLYFVPVNGNAEEAMGEPVVIQPQGTHTFSLSQTEIDSITTTRQGGVYRLETDLPIVAYQHSPIGSTATNDASMLLPEYALTGNYIVSSYPATVGAYPSYFLAIGTTDGTTVDITVGGATAGGGGIPALANGQSTQVMLDRYEVLNMVVAQQNGGDLSGTIISSDNPVHLIGATECANVPQSPYTYCDHMEEAAFPLEYWGEEYVGAHAPTRGNEQYHWRVYGGDDGLTINTAPQQPGFPLNLDKGEYYQFATSETFVITGDGPFLPVQYLESENPNAGTGDPAMYQMVPTEQFLNRYAFVTGENYDVHYAQITRPAGGAEVTIDGNPVGGYYQVGAFEVADVTVGPGAHFAASEQPFGVVQVGYTGVTSYAYPGGLKLEVINPQ